MKAKDIVLYPVVFTEISDEDGHYFGVESPNIRGMHSQGETFEDAFFWAEDAIATMLDGENEYPDVMNPADWKLEDNQFVNYVKVDMKKWYREKALASVKTITRSVTIPEYLNELAKDNNINVSRVLTEALSTKLGVLN